MLYLIYIRFCSFIYMFQATKYWGRARPAQGPSLSFRCRVGFVLGLLGLGFVSARPLLPWARAFGIPSPLLSSSHNGRALCSCRFVAASASAFQSGASIALSCSTCARHQGFGRRIHYASLASPCALTRSLRSLVSPLHTSSPIGKASHDGRALGACRFASLPSPCALAMRLARLAPVSCPSRASVPNPTRSRQGFGLSASHSL